MLVGIFISLWIGHVLIVYIQGCISCGTCSYPELIEDHVLTSVYVKIFRTVTRNAVNKGVWRKKDCSWPPLNKYAMNVWLSSLRIRAHLSWRTGKHLHVLHVLRTYSTCSYPGYQDTTTYAALIFALIIQRKRNRMQQDTTPGLNSLIATNIESRTHTWLLTMQYAIRAVIFKISYQEMFNFENWFVCQFSSNTWSFLAEALSTPQDWKTQKGIYKYQFKGM